MKLCCKGCMPDCAFCINFISNEYEDSCALGSETYCTAAKSYPCEYFECFMYENEERENTRLEISKEEYLRDYEGRNRGFN